MLKNIFSIRLGVLFFLILIFFLGNVWQHKAPKDFNIVLISIDTLRPDHMGIYGYNKNTTPNIDKFAKEAVVFTNAYTVVPMTFPSFSSLMTGLSPFSTHIFDNRGIPPISPNTYTLASILKANGYVAGAFTTIQIAPRGLSQGFDLDNYRNYKNTFINDSQDGKIKNREGYDHFVGQSLEWLSKNKNNKFFLWVHLLDPHAPYFPPEEYRCKFNSKYCDDLKDISIEDEEKLRLEYDMCQENVPEDRLEKMETLYDGGVANSDRLAGLILDKVEKLNLDKNTIVIIYGDHGEGFDHDYYFSHGQVLYNSAIHIPLIIKYPSNQSGSKKDLLIQNIDLYPTLLNLLGINYKKNLDGTSFASVVANSFNFINSDQNKYKFSSNGTLTKFAVYDNHYKYIYSLPGSCQINSQIEEFYDMKNDYNERNNLAIKDADLKNKYKKILMDYLSKYNLPLNIPRFEFPTLPIKEGTPSSRVDFRYNSVGE